MCIPCRVKKRFTFSNTFVIIIVVIHWYYIMHAFRQCNYLILDILYCKFYKFLNLFFFQIISDVCFFNLLFIIFKPCNSLGNSQINNYSICSIRTFVSSSILSITLIEQIVKRIS